MTYSNPFNTNPLRILVAILLGTSIGPGWAQTPPTISDIADQITNVDVPAGPYPFTVFDLETDPGLLTVTGTSSNLSLVPASGIVFGGSGSNRTVTLNPAAGRSGTTLITVTVSDAVETASDTFILKVNQLPRLLANNPLVMDQGTAAVITQDLLVATDAESPPDQVTYTLSLSVPRSGELRLNGDVLGLGGTFTQRDINEGRVVYQHDDSFTTFDDWPFTVSDADGGEIPGPPYYSYAFRVYINLVNHAPVAGHESGSTIHGMPFHGVLPATDRDEPAQTLHYRIVTNGVKGTAVITDTNTGAFDYTANPGAQGSDTITFQVNDGELDSVEPGTFTIALRPLALSESYTVLESSPRDGLLPATNAVPPHTLTYRIVTNGALGTAVITDTNTGAFTYTPNPGVIGADIFAFVVNDGFADSAPATCTVRIQPIIEPGDLFVTDIPNHLLIYVDRKTAAPSVVAAEENLFGPKACVLSRTGDLLVIDGGGGVVRLDLADGTQTVVSPGTNFSMGNFGSFGIAEESDGTILVADGPNGLVRVAPDTGAVTPLAQGGNLLVTLGVAVAANGDIFVTDAAAAADPGQTSRVVRIDPVNGAQTVISAGTNLLVPVGIAVEGPDTVVVSDAAGFAGGLDRVLRIDVNTGVQSIVSEEGNLALPLGLGIDDLGTIVVVSQGGAEVIEVNPVTGDQSVIVSAGGSAGLLGLAVARGAVLPDSDGDGLPDWWEQRHFPYLGAQPGEDPDGDGLDNRGEFKAGTDPGDRHSVLKLGLRPAPEGGVILEWSSVINRFYTLERSPALSHEPGAFTPFRTGIEATPPTNSLPDAEAGAGRNYFYRLRLEE